MSPHSTAVFPGAVARRRVSLSLVNPNHPLRSVINGTDLQVAKAAVNSPALPQLTSSNNQRR